MTRAWQRKAVCTHCTVSGFFFKLARACEPAHINSKVNSTTTHRSHGLVQILALRVGLVFGLKISSEYCSSRPATVTAKCRSPELCVSSKIDVPGGSGSWAFQLLGFM